MKDSTTNEDSYAGKDQGEHTPGPWVLDMESRTATVRTAGGKAIARCYQGDLDGQLIAATPETTQTLEDLADIVEAYLMHGDVDLALWVARARYQVAVAESDLEEAEFQQEIITETERA